ncbi:GIY-YIG nuclease family protein [Phenylobacterium sp.]|uniref:GIY-YIG nuclease family protein n=1 Tax=Phenylobacterium sp. TaxID=1871053 RepID=UPI00286E1998|nr:GIY-YIG nuclease family protein [Phenylobacterium sp.]
MLALRKQPLHVYVATDATGHHKIGVTQNPKLRAYQIGRDRGRPVRLVHVEPMAPNAEAVEITAHLALLSKHEGGEWFSVSEGDAVAAVVAARETVDAGVFPETRLAMLKSRKLGPAIEQQIKTARGPRESRMDFLRVAVLAELKRRERAKPKA